jgi:hypothetical protein
MSEQTIDLRSYFPEFTRTVPMPDGVDYLIRELTDVPVGAFKRIIADEAEFEKMKFLDRHEVEKQHLQLLLVVPLTIRGSAPKGEHTLRIDGEGSLELEPGDVVHVSGGLYFERNVVEALSEDGRVATVEHAWRFDGGDGARVYRAVRLSVLDELTLIEFAKIISRVKAAPDSERKDGAETERPPLAASGPTSLTSSLP